MNTLRLITKNLVIVFLIVCSAGTSVFSNPPNNTDIQKRLNNLNTVINTKLTDEVSDFINKYVDKRRDESELILGRTSLYFPFIENIIREKGLPDELKYIAVIESNLNPGGVSHQGAAGIWQFMKGTAELYGLTINKYVDERKDLAKSTSKALDHLKDLYNIYNDWTLAIAAYNCGSGTVNKAIKKSGGETDFWKLRKYLPRQTQNYIPRFIAASYLMKYYYLHDLQPRDASEDLKFVLTIKVNNTIDMDKVRKEFDIDENLIKSLNPSYKKSIIPGYSDYTLTLPDTKMIAFMTKYGGDVEVIPNAYGICRARYNEESGTFLLACDANSTINIINSLALSSTAVRDNFLSHKNLSEIANKLEVIQAANGTVLHRMNRKESLLDIAEANNMTLSDLLALNDIDENRGIKPGSLIRIR